MKLTLLIILYNETSNADVCVRKIASCVIAYLGQLLLNVCRWSLMITRFFFFMVYKLVNYVDILCI